MLDIQSLLAPPVGDVESLSSRVMWCGVALGFCLGAMAGAALFFNV